MHSLFCFTLTHNTIFPVSPSLIWTLPILFLCSPAHYLILYNFILSHCPYTPKHNPKQCPLHISHLCALESSWGQRAEKEVLSDTRYFNLRLTGGLLNYFFGYLKHNSLPKVSLAFHIYLFFVLCFSFNERFQQVKKNVQKTRLTVLK